MHAISLATYHLIQIWLVLDIIGGLWLAYEVQRAPRLDWHD
jgi:hypothetical protein